MNPILTIWKKELKDTIRDRRTLMSSIILPMVLMPVIIIGMGKLTLSQIKSLEEKTVKLAVGNEAAAPDFMNTLRALPRLTLSTLDGDPTAAVRDQKVDGVLVLPDDFSTKLEARVPVELPFYVNSLNNTSSTALTRVSEAVTVYNQSLLLTRLGNQGIGPEALTGLTINRTETATSQELGGFGLGFLLPLFIIMWASIGGQYTAVDVSAGEKERKTLEALLLTPARRRDIVAGKFLAVATTALISVVIALTSLYAVFLFGGADLFTSTTTTGGVATSFDFRLEPEAIGVMFAISVLLVAVFSAINLAVSIFAKSYKEAQSYIGPSYLVVILPVVAFNSVPGFVPGTPFFAIPFVNAVLLFKEVLVGTYNPAHILLTVAVMIVVAILSVGIASRIYHKEGVLFKD